MTPIKSGTHRHYSRLTASRVCGAIAILAVFAILVLMWLLMPPLR